MPHREPIDRRLNSISLGDVKKFARPSLGHEIAKRSAEEVFPDHWSPTVAGDKVGAVRCIVPAMATEKGKIELTCVWELPEGVNESISEFIDEPDVIFGDEHHARIAIGDRLPQRKMGLRATDNSATKVEIVVAEQVLNLGR